MKKLAAFLACFLAFGSVPTMAASALDSQDERRREKKRPQGDIVREPKNNDKRGDSRGDGKSRDDGEKRDKDGKRDKPKKPDDD